jgi:hypothetical protein
MSFAIRVSPFVLSSDMPPKYWIDRQRRGDQVLTQPYEISGKNVERALFMGLSSPIDLVRYEADDGAARIFESKTFEFGSLTCLVASMSSDRSSAILDISLFKESVVVPHSDGAALKIDDTRTQERRGEVKKCLHEFLAFIRL